MQQFINIKIINLLRIALFSILNSTSSFILNGIFLFFIFSSSLNAQVLNFTNYSGENGLPQLYIYSICQDKQGLVYFGTGEGLVRFNSKEFVTYTTNQGLAENFIVSVFASSDNTIWCGHYQNGVSYLKNGKIYTLENKLFENTTITAFAEDKYNNIYIGTSSNGVFQYNNVTKKTIQIIENTSRILQIQFIGNSNRFLLLEKYGIKLYDLQSNKKPKLVSETVLEVELADIAQLGKSNYFVAAKNTTPLMLTINESKLTIRKFITNLDDNYFNDFTKIIFHENYIYATSNQSGLFKLTISDSLITNSTQITKSNGLITNFLSSVFYDAEGNFWIGTNGFGIDFLRKGRFTLYNEGSLGEGNKNIHALAFDNNNTVWIGTSNSLIEFDLQNNIAINSYDKKKGFVDDEINSILIDKASNIWVGTSHHGLYRKLKNSSTFERLNQKFNLISDQITCIKDGNNGKIYIGTMEGLILYDSNLNTFKNITTNEGLTHNVISDILIDKKGRVWFASLGSPPFSFYNNQYSVYRDIKNLQNFKINSLCEDANGNIWFATEGEGIFRFDGKFFKSFTTNDGLLSNYCYSLIVDDENTIWTTHKIGVSSKRNNINNFLFYTNKDGFTSPKNNKNCLIKYKNNSLLFGTENGIIKCEIKNKESVKTPPKTIIEGIQINGKPFDRNNTTYPYSSYKISFKFISPVFATSPYNTYRYILKGLDTSFTYIDQSINEITYSHIKDGNYQFVIQACNENGIWNEQSISPVIHIKLPIWKLWWIYVILLMLMIYLIKLSYSIKTKNLIKRQVELEYRIDEKTKEIQTKNTELERQKAHLDNINRSVTDSINYAKKIQEAMLSSKALLYERQDDLFVLFLPRDIISGDFYWWHQEKYDKNIFTIAMADCTGHGVPGAMLSMLGISLFSKIAENNLDLIPSEILTLLDLNVRKALKQNQDSFSYDGMDAGVIRINYNNYTLEFSGANRTLILVRNEEIIELPASMFSIGAYIYGQNKKYNNEIISIQPNDMLYLFSDGYADQFGGDKNKRFMKKRLKLLLKDIYLQSIEEQKYTLNKAFEDWKGVQEQVDDVLVIGIKVK